jgi:hypothetical protein
VTLRTALTVALISAAVYVLLSLLVEPGWFWRVAHR